EAAGLRVVLAQGETAATIMAATRADLPGAPGAVVVTRGPGLASAVNGIAHAALDRLPGGVIAALVAGTRTSHPRIDQGARRPVVLLGTGAIPRTAAVRAALDGAGIPALHTYRARGVLPDPGPGAAGLVTGGTMEWPLLSAADLIVGLGVDEAEMIPARWDYAARTILVSEPGAPPSRGWFTGATELTMPLAEALDVLAAGPGGTTEWPADAGRAARAD